MLVPGAVGDGFIWLLAGNETDGVIGTTLLAEKRETWVSIWRLKKWVSVLISNISGGNDTIVVCLSALRALLDTDTPKWPLLRATRFFHHLRNGIFWAI